MQVSGTILNQTGAAVQVIALDMAIYLSLSMATLLALRFYERRLAWGAQR
jgi:general L-amino acid transport system permease protein